MQDEFMSSYTADSLFDHYEQMIYVSFLYLNLKHDNIGAMYIKYQTYYNIIFGIVFSGYTGTQTYKVILGPVSASLYYLHYIHNIIITNNIWKHLCKISMMRLNYYFFN